MKRQPSSDNVAYRGRGCHEGKERRPLSAPDRRNGIIGGRTAKKLRSRSRHRKPKPPCPAGHDDERLDGSAVLKGNRHARRRTPAPRSVTFRQGCDGATWATCPPKPRDSPAGEKLRAGRAPKDGGTPSRQGWPCPGTGTINISPSRTRATIEPPERADGPGVGRPAWERATFSRWWAVNLHSMLINELWR